MATDNNKTFSLICGGKPSLRYLVIAASVGLPKALFLGRMVVQVTKPTAAAEKQAATFMRAAPGARRKTTAKAGRRRRK